MDCVPTKTYGCTVKFKFHIGFTCHQKLLLFFCFQTSEERPLTAFEPAAVWVWPIHRWRMRTFHNTAYLGFFSLLRLRGMHKAEIKSGQHPSSIFITESIYLCCMNTKAVSRSFNSPLGRVPQILKCACFLLRVQGFIAFSSKTNKNQEQLCIFSESHP